MDTIPKVIHYVWVGSAPLSPLSVRCMASWKKYLPEYELRFWDESNIPMQHPYVAAMYRSKKWAFVADYVRFWALENEGGVYLDTDTVVLRDFDPLLSHHAFFGQTKDGITAAGVIGAVPHHQVIKDILAVYDKDVTYQITRTSPRTVTDILASHTYAGVTVYDYRYFNPCDDGEVRTKEKLALAYTDNMWAESWVPYARVRKILRRTGLMKMLKFFYGAKN